MSLPQRRGWIERSTGAFFGKSVPSRTDDQEISRRYGVFGAFIRHKSWGYKAASDAAHGLKGLSGNLGFNSLFILAGRMNQQGKAGDYSNFESFFSELKPEYERIVEAIRKLE
jgi:HPt (histidine-containing phosphotransfer) domain-containing protein